MRELKYNSTSLAGVKFGGFRTLITLITVLSANSFFFFFETSA
jgi:hypothetical protein